jgi:hypothetical protein
MYVPFDIEKKSLSTYFGSQTNHELMSKEGVKINSVKEAIKYLEDQKTNPLIIEEIRKYYKTASAIFKPVVIPKNLIAYKQIAKNAIQLSFNPYNGFSLTAASMVTIKEDKPGLIQSIGPLSIGGPNE